MIAGRPPTQIIAASLSSVIAWRTQNQMRAMLEMHSHPLITREALGTPCSLNAAMTNDLNPCQDIEFLRLRWICLDVQVRRETAAGKGHQNEQVEFAAKTVS